MKIGILGGTFNPIHNGHLMIASYVGEEFDLDQVLVMPNHHPAYKETIDLISDEHRSNMVQLAIKDKRRLVFSDFEMQREGNTYTVDTLRLLKEGIHKNDELYFIMGEDSLAYFLKWYCPEEITKLAHIIVTKRQSASLHKCEEYKAEIMAAFPNAKILISNCPFYELSSSEIRNRIHNGQNVDYMIPDEVIAYINEHSLYH